MSRKDPVCYDLSFGLVSIFRQKDVLKNLDLKARLASNSVKRTKFDLAFIDYNGAFTSLLNSEIPKTKRLEQNTGLVKVLSFSDNNIELEKYLGVVRKIAKLPISKIRQLKLDVEYRSNLKEICRLLYDEFDWHQVDATLVPLRGGGIIADSLPHRPKNMIPLESKRLPLSPRYKMGFGLGIPVSKTHNNKILFEEVQQRLQNIDGKTIRILEVAIASGLTTVSYLLYLIDNSIRPRHIEIVAPVANQQGVDLVLRTAKDLGLNVTFVIGKMYYRVGNFWENDEDTILDDNGDFVIGDASEILSKFLNIEQVVSDLVRGK